MCIVRHVIQAVLMTIHVLDFTNNNQDTTVSGVELGGLEDRLRIARKCAASTVFNFLFTRAQKCHTCLVRFLAGRTKARWSPFPSGIIPSGEHGVSENF